METKPNQLYIIRSHGAGVFAAEIAERRGTEVDLLNARRIWKWDGATECIQLAQDGVPDTGDNRITKSAPSMTVTGVLEIIPCSDEAAECFRNYKVWQF